MPVIRFALVGSAIVVGAGIGVQKNIRSSFNDQFDQLQVLESEMGKVENIVYNRPLEEAGSDGDEYLDRRVSSVGKSWNQGLMSIHSVVVGLFGGREA